MAAEVPMEQESTPSSGNDPYSNDPSGNDRRDFLKKCGKFAAVTPPAITMLLSTSLTSNAIAKSFTGKGGGASRGLKLGWTKNGKR